MTGRPVLLYPRFPEIFVMMALALSAAASPEGAEGGELSLGYLDMLNTYREMELREMAAGLVLQDARSLLDKEDFLHKQATVLYGKHAISEEEYREHRWHAADAAVKVSEAQALLDQTKVGREIATLVAAAAGGKPVDVAHVALLEVKRWELRHKVARLAVERGLLGTEFRDYKLALVQKLNQSGADTKTRLAEAKHKANEARHHLDTAREAEVRMKAFHKDAEALAGGSPADAVP